MFLRNLYLILPLILMVRSRRENDYENLRQRSLKEIFDVYLRDQIPGIPRDGSRDFNHGFTTLMYKYGYLGQEREVVTEDGYVLTVHRIRNDNYTSNGRVIFLMHGIQDSSVSWIVQGPGTALAYILADNGYDVWMGNARENRHSQYHRRWTTKDKEFWNFTWEEIGVYDLPAMIDYVLETTKQKSLYYVGYWQGATTFYVMNSLRPEYNNKIARMFSLVPVAWLKHVKSPIISLFPTVYKVLEPILVNFDSLLGNTFVNKILSILCLANTQFCEDFFYIVNGDTHLFDKSLFPAIITNTPSGASIKQFVHYGQLMESGRFCRFDYGMDKNLRMYNSKIPPDYDLRRVSVPVTLYYSDKDWLSTPMDITTLKNNLRYVFSEIFVPDYSHLDFIYAFEAKDEIYFNIMKTIDENTHTGKKTFQSDQNLDGYRIINT